MNKRIWLIVFDMRQLMMLHCWVRLWMGGFECLWSLAEYRRNGLQELLQLVMYMVRFWVPQLHINLQTRLLVQGVKRAVDNFCKMSIEIFKVKLFEISAIQKNFLQFLQL